VNKYVGYEAPPSFNFIAGFFSIADIGKTIVQNMQTVNSDRIVDMTITGNELAGHFATPFIST
jgi:hypothetical protein